MGFHLSSRVAFAGLLAGLLLAPEAMGTERDDWRCEIWSGTAFDVPTQLSIELLHHRLFLRNPPSEVQSFSISHGFNPLTVGRRDRQAS